jgi:hypothetical protein
MSRPGVVITESGIMLIDIADTAPAAKTPASKPDKKTVKTAAQAAAKRPRLVKAARTPVIQVVKSVIAMGPKPWKDTLLQEPDAIFKHLRETGCGLRSRKTWLTYYRNLATVRRMCGGVPVATLLQHPEATLKTVAAAVKSTGLSLHTHAGLLNAVLACMRHALPCKAKAAIKKATETIQKAHQEIHLQADQGAITNRASARQQAGYVSYPQLCAIRDKLEPGSRERLLLSFLTLIPPARNDLACCKLFAYPPSEQEAYKGNYLVLQGKASYICYRLF